LLIGAEQQQPLHADRTVRTDRQRRGTVIATGLLQHARVARVAQSNAIVFLGDDEPEQAELAQRFHELRRLLTGLIPLFEVFLGVGKQAIDGIDDHAEHFLLLGVHGRKRPQGRTDDLAAEQCLGRAFVPVIARSLRCGGLCDSSGFSVHMGPPWPLTLADSCPPLYLY
jgi:hypothetical protein